MIRLDKVSVYQKRSFQQQAILRQISFFVGEGGFRWLIGDSGSGKTTLLRVIHLQEKPHTGSLEVLSTPVLYKKRKLLTQLRQKIGVVHQDLQLLPDITVYDNIALPLRLNYTAEAEIQKKVFPLLESFNMVEKAESFLAMLSGGEQQRVAIARALVTHPPLLLLDEPTSALDHNQTLRFMELVRSLNEKNTTIICATHNMSLPEQFPARYIRIHKGQITHEG